MLQARTAFYNINPETQLWVLFLYQVMSCYLNSEKMVNLRFSLSPPYNHRKGKKEGKKEGCTKNIEAFLLLWEFLFISCNFSVVSWSSLPYSGLFFTHQINPSYVGYEDGDICLFTFLLYVHATQFEKFLQNYFHGQLKCMTRNLERCLARSLIHSSLMLSALPWIVFQGFSLKYLSVFS